MRGTEPAAHAWCGRACGGMWAGDLLGSVEGSNANRDLRSVGSDGSGRDVGRGAGVVRWLGGRWLQGDGWLLTLGLLASYSALRGGARPEFIDPGSGVTLPLSLGGGGGGVGSWGFHN